MHSSGYRDLDVPGRILLGPGPSMVPPRVLAALSQPPVGYLDPRFSEIMDETQALLRYLFRTENEVTFPISGTGTAGMEAAIANFVEPGDRVLAAISGYFGERLAEIAGRYGAQVVRLERPWGEVFTPRDFENALIAGDFKLVTLVHGETSTGAVQTQVAEIAEIVHRHGALLVLDTVASLGGIPVEVDSWDVDICYSGSQKCISAPPGMAPFTVGARALEAFEKRKTPVANWYLDIAGLRRYWNAGQKSYHHTAPINLVYALREALRVILEEGIENRWARHRAVSEMLWQGLSDLGLPPRVPEESRMISLTAAALPAGLDEAAVRRRLLEDYNVEVAGGFGPLAGKIWRIGVMGYSCRRENVTLLLAALKELLP